MGVEGSLKATARLFPGKVDAVDAMNNPPTMIPLATILSRPFPVPILFGFLTIMIDVDIKLNFVFGVTKFQVEGQLLKVVAEVKAGPKTIVGINEADAIFGDISVLDTVKATVNIDPPSGTASLVARAGLQLASSVSVCHIATYDFIDRRCTPVYFTMGLPLDLPFVLEIEATFQSLPALAIALTKFDIFFLVEVTGTIGVVWAEGTMDGVWWSDLFQAYLPETTMISLKISSPRVLLITLPTVDFDPECTPTSLRLTAKAGRYDAIVNNSVIVEPHRWALVSDLPPGWAIVPPVTDDGIVDGLILDLAFDTGTIIVGGMPSGKPPGGFFFRTTPMFPPLLDYAILRRVNFADYFRQNDDGAFSCAATAFQLRPCATMEGVTCDGTEKLITDLCEDVDDFGPACFDQVQLRIRSTIRVAADAQNFAVQAFPRPGLDAFALISIQGQKPEATIELVENEKPVYRHKIDLTKDIPNLDLVALNAGLAQLDAALSGRRRQCRNQV